MTTVVAGAGWSRLATTVAMLVVAPATALGLLTATGSLGPALPGLPSPGRVTQVGLPVTQALRDMAAMVTVGFLAFALTCVPPDDVNSARLLTGTRRRLVDLGGHAALAWTGLSLALVVLTYSDAAGEPFSAAGFADQAMFFATEYDLGRYLLASCVLAILVSLVALATRSVRVAGIACLLAIAGLWPMALTAHGAGALRHDLAVDAQFAHLVGVSVWGGGLVALAVVGRGLVKATEATVRRYSTVAGWCFVVVATAGIAGAVLRVDSIAALRSSYGLLLGLKVASALLLGVAGLAHRRRTLTQLTRGSSRAFRRLLVVEVFVMLAAAGTAVALNRTPPPPGVQRPLSRVEDMLGYPMPDPLSAADWFTTWRLDGFWTPIALVMVVLYMAGVVRLQRRGDAWSVGRTVAWVGGWVLLVWATSGAPGAYGRVLFSMHMVQHMTIATTVPVLLVLGAPVTLALRALHRRTDKSMGPREWVLATVHSPFVSVLGRPVVAGILFVGSLVVFYYSSLFEVSLESHTGHILMTAHFLIVGYLFAGCLVGIDPGLHQTQYPLRVLMVMVVFGFHALFSVSLMASTQVLAESWFKRLDRPWGDSLADDQYLGASLGWALGDYPLALLAVVLVFGWVRADRRERVRFDRQEDRDGGSQLAAYNAYLAQVSARDGAPTSALVDPADPVVVAAEGAERGEGAASSRERDRSAEGAAE